MGLFSSAQMDKINQTAKKSNSTLKESSRVSMSSINKELTESSNAVLEYFSDSKSILMTSKEQLHNYINECIKAGIVAIDTETTGLDRIKDYVVGVSLYYPGGIECYIPIKHLVPLFEEPYKNQLTYEEVAEELQRLVDNKVKMIFANADFDLAMIYKDFHVDMCDVCYYDVLIAWRCIKEDEKKNGLKELYNKYVLKGQGEPRKFSDFFSPKLFPYCKPEIAKLYAANDTKITYELYRWQLKFITKGSKTCQKYHMEHIANLVWDIEFPLIKICQRIHRVGSYIDMDTAKVLNKRYAEEQEKELKILQDMVQEVINNAPYSPSDKRPFTSGKDFNPQSQPQVKYLLYDLMKIPSTDGKNGKSTDKKILQQVNIPITNQILKVRSLGTLIGTFVKKMPNATTPDNRIHAQMKQMGAATGRLSCIAEGTKIRTSIYHTINIENVKQGDYICCLNHKNQFQTSKVLNVWNNGEKECIKITYSIIGSNVFEELICTSDHLILTTNSEWVRAENLFIGDVLVGYNHINCIVTQKEKETIHTVYDIEVEKHHNFIANDICVHNCSDPNLMNIPSHANDIRHMFRATPSQNLELNCEDNEDNQIQIELSYYDSIPNEFGEMIKIHDLEIGDKISLQNEYNETVLKHVFSISDSKDDLSKCELILGE